MGWIRGFGLGAAVAAAALGAGSAARPQDEGFFAAGGLQDGGRAIQDAVRLGDGRVFVVGGYGNADGSSRASAEVYDPETDAWSLAGTMSTGRSITTSSLLPDGRVLVAGGSSLAPVFSSTEIWDPATSLFSAGPSMSAARFAHSAVTLADGRILVCGGNATTANPAAVATAEIYDPSLNSWSSTGSMLHARQNHRSVLLGDGRVLVAGGDPGSPLFQGTVQCQIYDPALGTFSAAASMASPRAQFAMARLPDGRVLAVGGNQNATGSPIQTAEVYDPVTNSWSSAGSTTCGGTQPTLTVLADGRALAAGGVGLGTVPYSSADLFDPDSGTFSPAPSMLHARRGHSATLLADGSVLLAGGYDGAASYPYWTATAERFVPAAIFTPRTPCGFEGSLTAVDEALDGAVEAGDPSAIRMRTFVRKDSPALSRDFTTFSKVVREAEKGGYAVLSAEFLADHFAEMTATSDLAGIAAFQRLLAAGGGDPKTAAKVLKAHAKSLARQARILAKFDEVWGAPPDEEDVSLVRAALLYAQVQKLYEAVDRLAAKFED